MGNEGGIRRTAWRWSRRLTKVGLLLAVGATLFWMKGALYRHFVRFPKEEKAWIALRAQHRPVAERTKWREFRGILHAHSRLSHDSEVRFEAIQRVLVSNRLDFICLSDHCVEGRADFSLQWRGLRGGKLFVPGYEMKDGLMPFGVNSRVVLSNQTELAVLARQVVTNGGVLFFAHPEEPRRWDQPELTGMEIYNLHRDFKTKQKELAAWLPDLVVNQSRYPEHVLRLFFERPTPFLRRWDDLSRTRHITAIAGNDCHQNVGLRAVYTPADTIRIEDTSPKRMAEFKLNKVTRFLVESCLGRLETNRALFQVQLDPYERTARFVNTHALCRELSEPALLDALRAGRVFIGFDLIADSSSFLWLAEAKDERVVMGEDMAFSTNLRLRALSPLPCRFTVVKDGQPAFQVEGRAMEWIPPGPGKYRVEAELLVLDEWIPWIYANPIQLR